MRNSNRRFSLASVNYPKNGMFKRARPVIARYRKDGAGNLFALDRRDGYRPDGSQFKFDDPKPPEPDDDYQDVRTEPEYPDPDSWSAMEPLPSGMPPVSPFDLDLLPNTLRAWIGDIAERMQCPEDYPAVSAIVCLSSVVGRQVGIRPKRQDDWTVIPNLWGAIVGRPSLLKTPSLQETMKGIDALEARAREEHEQDQTTFAADQMISEARAKEFKAEISKALKAKNLDLAHQHALDACADAAQPKRRRYKTQDSTVEKLGELLRDNPRGMLVYRDELIGFLKSLDQEGREGSRAFYLEAWNGNGGFTFDRIGRGTVEIEAACVSIIGGIQPGPLNDYLAGVLRGGAGDDGLLQRFQLAVWPDAPTKWRNIDRWPDARARQVSREVFSRLDQIDPHALGATQDDGDAIPWLRFAPDAQEAFDEWRAALESRLRSDDMHPAMESHLAKYRSLAPSLALLFRLADNPGTGPVDLHSLLRALAWCEYLETHSRRIYRTALDVDMASALELSRRLPSLSAPFTAKDVYRNHWRLLDRTGTAAAIVILEDFGHIRGDQPSGPGRPTIRYQVRPDLRGTRE
jgi:putative DNA primase/helicase